MKMHIGWFVIPKLWNINKQKLQLNSIGTPEEIDLTTCDNTRAGKEGERLLSFPGNNSANEKRGTSYLIFSSLQTGVSFHWISWFPGI